MANDKNGSAFNFKEKLKGFFTKNLAIKIVALVFAVLLWSYVMVMNNPMRTKSIPDVTASFSGDGDLLARQLTLRGDRNELLSQLLTVQVRAQLTDYSNLNADDITVKIDLQSINTKGEYTINYTAETSTGTVVNISPSSITVEVDDLVRTRIPLSYELEGEMPEGYWADPPTLSSSDIDIEGAKSDIDRIVKGIVHIDQSEINSKVSERYQITFYDNDGEVVDKTFLGNQDTRVTVQMNVYARKTVPINIDAALIGRDDLHPNYEIREIRLQHETLDIVGSEALLSMISSLDIDTIDLTGSTESFEGEVRVALPNGVWVLENDTRMVSYPMSLVVHIAEKMETASYNEMEVQLENVPRRMEAVVDNRYVNVTIYGRISLLDQLERSNIEVYADLEDLPAGEHSVPLNIRVPSSVDRTELDVSFDFGGIVVGYIIVTIR